MDLLEKNASHDDGIIDLTDIIEQGSPSPSAKPNAEPTMDAQMDTLFTQGNKEAQNLVPDAMDDIDSLLAEMSDNLSASEPAAQPSQAASAPVAPPSQAASAAPVLNPDETLDMPNMSEVDALLQDLDIPPQPTQNTAAAIPDEIGDDIDSMLGDLMDGSAKATPKAPAAATPAPSPAMDMDDLDALLATAAAKPETQKAAPKPKAEPAAEPAMASAPTLDDDLDALLGTQPAEPVEEPSFDDELEALLAAASTPSPAPEAEQPSVAPAAKEEKSPKEAKSPAELPSLEEDLDALFNDIGSDTSPVDADTPLLSPKEEDDTPIDLSDLDDSSPSVAPAPANVENTGTEGFEEISTLMADVTDPHDVLTASPAVDIAMLSTDDMADMPHMPRSTPKDEEDLPELDALDDLLQAASAMDTPAPQADSSADLGLASDASHAINNDDMNFSDEEIAQAAQELYDEKVMVEATIGDVDTGAWLNSLDEVLDDTDDTATPQAAPTATAPKGDDSDTAEPAPMTESIDQLLAHLPEDPDNNHYIYRPSATDAARGSATVANRQGGAETSTSESTPFEKTYEHELARLQHITDRFAQSLAAADMHIAALTNTTAKTLPPQSSDSTGDSPVAGCTLASGISGLDQRLDGLSTHMQKLQERITALEDGNKEARLQTVEARVDGQVKTIIHLEERCKILEAHLEAQAKSQANLENRFQYEVERAAAAAAAKIIREEIAGILAGQ